MKTKEFKLIKDYYLEGNIHTKDSVEIEDGLTVLVGCNGSGKTTFLSQIKSQLEKDNSVKLIHFNNLTDGGSNSISSAMFHGNTGFAASMVMSSEGERIYHNMGNLLHTIGRFIRDPEGKKELFVLMDAVDSGFSIDNIIELKEMLHHVIDDIEAKGIDCYIIASANEYELASDEKCFDVHHCKYIKFNKYEDYKKFIIKSAKAKEKRIEREMDKQKERRESLEFDSRTNTESIEDEES